MRLFPNGDVPVCQFNGAASAICARRRSRTCGSAKPRTTSARGSGRVPGVGPSARCCRVRSIRATCFARSCCRRRPARAGGRGREAIVPHIRTALVTGCAGFIGSHLTERLLASGVRVIGVDSFDDYYDPGLKVANLEPRCGPRVRARAGGPDRPRCRRLAGRERASRRRRAPSRHPRRAPLARGARALRARERAGHATSARPVLARRRRAAGVCGQQFGLRRRHAGAVCGDGSVRRPKSPYAATKRAGELLCRVAHETFAAPITVVRLFTVYGPRSDQISPSVVSPMRCWRTRRSSCTETARPPGTTRT